MPESTNTPNFKPSELASVDQLITHLQAQGVGQDEPTPLTTPVAAVVAQAVIATAAVLCTKVPEDNDKIQKIADLASQLKTSTTLNNLVELRKRAVQSASR